MKLGEEKSSHKSTLCLQPLQRHPIIVLSEESFVDKLQTKGW